MRLDWYFDFISPFAYLQFHRLDDLPPGVEVRRQPVLFAAMLNHWGQLGPAEIAPKRRFTYEHVTWLAARAGLPLRPPAAHPFNPLPLLRLSWALGNTRSVVERLFRFVWEEGHIPQQDDPWAALLRELGLAPGFESSTAKEQLKAATEAAIATGAFGVPTAIIQERLFWGYDATDMLIEFCRSPGAFDTEAMRLAAQWPVGTVRPRKPTQ
jgi:2-hydroxychromene-2-carboxylate isomerase